MPWSVASACPGRVVKVDALATSWERAERAVAHSRVPISTASPDSQTNRASVGGIQSYARALVAALPSLPEFVRVSPSVPLVFQRIIA